MSASSEASKKKKKFPKQSPAVMNTQAINLVSDDVDYDGDDDMGEKNEECRASKYQMDSGAPLLDNRNIKFLHQDKERRRECIE